MTDADDLADTFRVRWRKDDPGGEHGAVKVTHHHGDRTDVYTFAAVDRERERYQREYADPHRAEFGAQRSVPTDGGPVAGLALEFQYRRRLVHGKQTDATKQTVPPEVAEELFERGAARIEA